MDKNYQETHSMEVNELRENRSLSVCSLRSLSPILLLHQVLRALAIKITLNIQILRLPHATQDTCNTVKYQFRARCARCAWQQWELIYLCPEKERTMVYLIIVVRKKHWYSQFFNSRP